VTNFYKSLFCLIPVLFSPLIFAGQNDYDGKWNVDISCSINSNTQMPAFDYKEVWTIQNGSIFQVSNKKTKQGDEQTVWNGKISNKAVTINAEGNNDSTKKPWLWTGNGLITGNDLFQISADMIGRIGTKVRDCTLKFTSLDPAVGSLAYLQGHPEVKKPTPQPEVTKQSTPKLPEPKAVAESKPISSVDKDVTKSNVAPKTIEEPKNPESTGTGMLNYLLGAVGIVLVSGGIFAVTRKRKDPANEKAELIQKSKKDSEDKEAELAQKAHELEIQKLRLQEAKNEIEAKEVLAAQKAQALKDEAEKELVAIRKRAEEELATARAMNEALMLKQQAVEELAKAEAMKKSFEAEAKLSLEKKRNEEELAKVEALKKINEEKAQFELEKKRAEVSLAKEKALKDAEERKRKADEEYEQLKKSSETFLPTPEPVSQTQLPKCSSCSNVLRVGAKFCNKCGAKAA